MRFGRDVFDNCVAACTFSIRLTNSVFTRARSRPGKKEPVRFFARADLLSPPVRLSGGAAARACAVSKDLEQTTAGNSALDSTDRGAAAPDGSRSVEINERLHECIGYERREEGPARPPEETLRIGKGACRDVALLLAAILRQPGLAARLTSGYLREADSDSSRAEGSLHAWTEVYLPGAGWVGMDATTVFFVITISSRRRWELSRATSLRSTAVLYRRGPTDAQMTSRLELFSL